MRSTLRMAFLQRLLLRALAWQLPFKSQSAKAIGKPIIIDTDIYSDVDDVGALAVANVLHNCGIAQLKAVMVNSPSKYGSPAVSAINTYFGNGDVPIGALRPFTTDTFFDKLYLLRGEYAAKIAHHYPRTLDNSTQAFAPAKLYREILASSEDNSVTIISIGFLDNLAALLNSTADSLSDLDGWQLAQNKVRELVIMGGQYPR